MDINGWLGILKIYCQVMIGHQGRSATKVRIMAILLILFEVGIMFAYGFGTEMTTTGVFFRTSTDNSSLLIVYILPAILAILGWGLIIAYSENSAIAGLMTTLLATGFSVQVQPLLIIFWRYVYSEFTGVYAVSIVEYPLVMIMLVSLMICLCGLSGRLGVVETFVVIAVFNNGWPMNYFLLLYIKNQYWTGEIAEVFDSIGSAYVYLFAGVFSIIVSLFLNFKEGVKAGQSGSRQSAFIGLIGTGFAFAACPYTDYNGLFGATTTTPYRFEGPLNVYFALTASVITTYAFSAIFGSFKVGVREALVGVLGGAAIVGACAGFINNIGACIAIGALGGAVSGFWLRFVHTRINTPRTFDHLGIVGPITINAFLGLGVIAPIVFAAYNQQNLAVAELSFVVTNYRVSTYYLGILGITLVIAIGNGLIAGAICFLTRDSGDDFHFGKLVSTDFGLYSEGAGQAYIQNAAGEEGHPHHSAGELRVPREA